MQTSKIKWFTCSLVAVAAAIGAVFGVWGQMAWYTKTEGDFVFVKFTYPIWVGALVGIIAGVITGLAYLFIITPIACTFKRRPAVVICGSMLGVVAGVICSVIFHGSMMWLHRISFPDIPMLAGVICGGPAGLLVGIVFSSIWPINAEQNSD